MSWLVLLHSFSDGNHEKQFHKDKCVRFFMTLKWQQLLCIEMGKIHRNRFGIVYLSSRFHYMPECCLWIGFRAYVVKVPAPQQVFIISDGAFMLHPLHFLINFQLQYENCSCSVSNYVKIPFQIGMGSITFFYPKMIVHWLKSEEFRVLSSFVYFAALVKFGWHLAI